MKRMMILCAVLGLVASLPGCASGPSDRMVDWYGSYKVDDENELSVSTLGLSQIQFELRHSPSDRVLVRDVGSAKQGWFFVWDEHGRLWAHWDNTGTVVWLQGRDGRYHKHPLSRNDPILNEVPEEFAANLPGWAKRSLGI